MVFVNKLVLNAFLQDLLNQIEKSPLSISSITTIKTQLNNIYNYQTNTFIINEYKTAKVNHEPIVFTAPKDLQKLILDSLIRTGERAYLLWSENGGKNKPISANVLGHLIQRISTKLFNLDISVNDIRHSFIDRYNITTTNDIELLYKNAKQMGHSYKTSVDLYRKNYSKN